MYIINKTRKTIILTEVIAGQDLVIRPEEKTIDVAPNPKLLSKLLVYQDELEFHTTKGSEIAAISEIDSRFDTLIILD